MNTQTPTSLTVAPPMAPFAMLLLMLVLAALDQTVVSTALPSIARDLHGVDRLPWVFSAYLLAATVAVPLYGKLADRHGARPVLLVAVALFVVGSALCGASRSMDELVLARGLQGAGGGGFLTLAMTAVVQLFEPQARSRLQGLLGAAYGLSTLAGPLVGGLLVEHVSWRWAFFLNLPAGALALAVLTARFPRSAPPQRTPLDWAGALLLSGALICVLLATRRGNDFAVELAALGSALALAFAWVQTRALSPLLPPSLFARPGFAAAVALAAASGLMLFASVVYLPLYFQTLRGLSPAASGAYLMPLLLGITVASIGCGRVLSATGRVRSLALGACLLAGASFALMGWVLHQAAPPVALLSAVLLPLGLGIGTLFPLVTVVAQTSAPGTLIGIATASPVMFRSVAGAVGVALLSRMLSGGLSGPALGTVMWCAAALSLLALLAAARMPQRLQRAAPPVATVGASAGAQPTPA